MIGDYRFVDERPADGRFWDEVLAHVPLGRIIWTPEILSYYNALRP